MKKILFLILIFMSSVVSAQTDDWTVNSQDIVMDISIGSTIDVIRSGGSDIEYLNAEVLFLPKDDVRQQVLDISFNPQATVKSNSVVYSWDDAAGEVEFGYTAEVKAENRRNKITSKIPYPLRDIPTSLIKYTQPSENIDSNSASVRELSKKLVEGEDDLYKVSFKLAKWVEENIEYSLDTLTAEASRSASWVLKNEIGVCDELSTLFIALARSAGIPARYVSGVAYTNYNDLNDWGPHAWAEVYFPGKGWIQFDIAYSQLGFVDGSHIALKVAEDSDSVSTRYELRARNVDIETEKLDINVELKETIGEVTDLVSLDSKLLKPEVGFDSYNLIETTVKNNADYYYPISIFLANTESIDLLTGNKQHILLEPNEEKKIYWTLKVEEGLNENFIYTFPMEVYTQHGIISTNDFTVVSDGVRYSKSDVEDLIDLSEVDESEDLSLFCDTNQEVHYIDNLNVEVECELNNLGEGFLTGSICLVDECQFFEVEDSENFVFKIDNVELGRRELRIVADYGLTKTEYVEVDVQERPDVMIKDIGSVGEIRFEDEFEIKFVLGKVGFPKDVIVKLKNGASEKLWEVGDLAGEREFVISMKGDQLRKGLNVIDIIASFEDSEGNVYVSKEEVEVNLVDVTFGQNIKLMFNSFSRWISSLF